MKPGFLENAGKQKLRWSLALVCVLALGAGLTIVSSVYPLAPRSQLADIAEAMNIAPRDPLQRYRIEEKDPSKRLKMILSAAWEDIWLTEELKSDRAIKIFRNNSPRMEDLLERLRDHGQHQLHLDDPTFAQMFDIVSQLRTVSAVSKGTLSKATGFRQPEEFLLALDHALDPDPYHPIRPRSFYLARSSRLLLLPFYHGVRAEGDSQIVYYREQLTKLKAFIAQTGVKKVWLIFEDYPAIGAFVQPQWQQIQPAWEKTVDQFMRDLNAGQGFTMNSMTRYPILSSVDQVWEAMGRSFTRSDIDDIAVHRTWRRRAVSFWLQKLMQEVVQIPEVCGIHYEPGTSKTKDRANAILAEYLLQYRFLKRYIDLGGDWVKAYRIREFLDTVYGYVERDDRFLDYIGDLLEGDRDPQTAVAILRGSSHQLIGRWLNPAFQINTQGRNRPAEKFLGDLLNGGFRWHRLPDEKFLMESILPATRRIIDGRSSMPDQMNRHVQHVLEKMDSRSLRELHGWMNQHMYCPGMAVLWYLQNNGKWPGDAPLLWRDLVEFRFLQLIEAEYVLSTNSKISGHMGNTVLHALARLRLAEFLTHDLSSDQREEYVQLLSEAYGLDAVIKKMFCDALGVGFQSGPDIAKGPKNSSSEVAQIASEADTSMEEFLSGLEEELTRMAVLTPNQDAAMGAGVVTEVAL